MLKIGDWLFDAATRRVLRGQVERKLSPKAAGVLLALAETPAQVWSRDALLERVWPGVIVGEEVLTHAIAELRRALGDDFRSPRFLQTVHKSGYRLLQAPAAVTSVALAPAAGAHSIDDDDSDGALDLRWYATYLKACEFLDCGGRENVQSAIALFLNVIEADPTFALAHAGAAKAMTFCNTYYAPQAGYFERALAHCAAVHRIDTAAGAAQAYAAEGLIRAIAGDLSRGLNRFRAAIQIDPNSAETHYLLGRAYLGERRLEDAALMLERAAALRGDDYHSLTLAGKVRESVGQAQAARANYALALQRIEPRLVVNPGDFRALCSKARCLWNVGHRDEAVRLMEAVAAHPDPLNYHLACTFARTGQHERALDVLEKVVEMGWNHKAFLESDPDFDALRDNRRFKRIERSLSPSSHQQL
jgi:DNA-binding winged helix-turn-helix (wHTH) protein/Flp pilus assembly protein TadD